MTETPRVELPSLLAQSDQVARTGAARIAARDTIERADQDYELELRSRERSEEVAGSERIASADGRRQRPRDEHARRERRPDAGEGDDADEGPRLVDVVA